jgi:adenosine kinase
MKALICGSLAFDTIMVFADQFKNHILPDKIHMLNVAFLVPEMRREFGGTAGNIAYNLKLLKSEPTILATVGEDFGPYTRHLERHGISSAHIRNVDNTFTAQAFITTDLDDNQITAFHPGAMNHSHLNSVNDAKEIGIGIIAPDGREGMFRHAAEMRAAHIPYIFDPGQGMPMFSGEELMHFIDGAAYVTVNDYEGEMMSGKTGHSIEALAARVKALIVTRGAEGSQVYQNGQQISVPSVKADAVIDPTGCGDAYRAGLIHGLLAGWEVTRACKLASVMGSIKIAHRGGQNHRPALADIAARFKAAFGEPL